MEISLLFEDSVVNKPFFNRQDVDRGIGTWDFSKLIIKPELVHVLYFE